MFHVQILLICLDLKIYKDGLDYQKLIGWNSDGASVMLGCHNNLVSHHFRQFSLMIDESRDRGDIKKVIC